MVNFASKQINISSSSFLAFYVHDILDIFFCFVFITKRTENN